MPPATFPFRPWVRSTTRRAMLWGVGIVVLLGGVAWVVQADERAAWGRGFGVLLAYSLLFWASLAKIWWTAGKPAVVIDAEGLSYQPLHTFRPKRIPFAGVLAIGPRAGTESLRFILEQDGVGREFFLNLAVVKGQHQFLERLGEELERIGLEKVPGRERSWRRPGWTGDAVMGVGG
jgi:hypothetical protein